MAAAISAWSERPVADVSLDHLAATAGHTRGAFHGNFADRGELVAEVLATITAEAGERIAAAVDAADDPLAGLAAYITTSLRFIADQPAKARALMAVVRHQEAAGDVDYPTLARHGAARLADLLRAGRAAGLVRDLDCDLTAEVIRVALDMQIRSGRVTDEATAQEVAGELAALFDAGVRRP